jgi:hypothetical protein
MTSNGFTTAAVANKCLDIIKEAREYWDIAHHDLVEYDPLPEVQKLPTKRDSKSHEYEYSKYTEKSRKARILFRYIHKIAWVLLPDNFEVGRLDDHRISTRPITIHKTNYMSTSLDYLLPKPDHLLTGAACVLGTDLAVYLDEVYAIFIIFEAWSLLHGLLLNKYNSTDISLIHDSLDYIDNIRDAAKKQREKQKLHKEKAQLNEKVSKNEVMEEERIKKSIIAKQKIKEDDKKKLIKIFKPLNIQDMTKKTRKGIIELINKATITESCKQGWSYGRIDNYLNELEDEGKILKLPQRQSTGPKKINFKT